MKLSNLIKEELEQTMQEYPDENMVFSYDESKNVITVTPYNKGSVIRDIRKMNMAIEQAFNLQDIKILPNNTYEYHLDSSESLEEVQDFIEQKVQEF